MAHYFTVFVFLISGFIGSLSQQQMKIPSNDNSEAVVKQNFQRENSYNIPHVAKIQPAVQNENAGGGYVRRGDTDSFNSINNAKPRFHKLKALDEDFQKGIIKNVDSQQGAKVVNQVGSSDTNNNNNNNNENNNNNLNNNNNNGNLNFNNNNENNNNNNNFNNFNNNNNNFQQQQNDIPRVQQRDVGGMKLNWDWSDFAISFNDYGAAEMKVRRAPHASTGEPWPLPQYYVKKQKRVYHIPRDDFNFKIVGKTCDILEEGAERYLDRVLNYVVEDMYDNLQNAEGTMVDDPKAKYMSPLYAEAPVIRVMELKVRKPCTKYPSINSDESYDLFVKKNRVLIWANEVWGLLRGLETFSQIVWKGLDNRLYVKETVISDYPRFPHRGILVDTSRHFLFKEIIFDIIDGMEANKMNVFHWHIVDDQSFPYQSKVYPDLSKKGAFHPEFVYTLEDIAEIIRYGRMRGVRIMPEFDSPGHTYAWGLSRPDLLTQCYQGNSPVKGYFGPIDPTKNSTYTFLKNLFDEILEVFQDSYLHLGGDEVPLQCWSSNPEVTKFGLELAKKEGRQNNNNNYNNNNNFNDNQQGFYSPGSFDVRKVYEYYETRLMKDLRDIGKKRENGVKFVMWQEVMNNNLQLPNDTLIQIWMGDSVDINRAINLGYNVLYSTCWYLDHVEYGTKWPKYYQCDPADNSYGMTVDEKKVLGGEACLWSEYVDNENYMTTLWPRASATAERLWSHKDVRDLDSASVRLQEHRCRMLKRGLSVGQISGPDYCLHRGPSRRNKSNNTNCEGGRCFNSGKNILQFEDIQLRLTQRGPALSECNSKSFTDMFKFLSKGSSMFIIATAAIIILAIGFGIRRPHGKFSNSKMCKNKTILILFLSVLVIYFMCYTTIWMQAFEFSGSFHKRLQKNNLDKR
ncbi:beta-hexosaminidase subunit beta isoform X1 [Patella vulgata]|uniref:beta-hexosaminidase subunit beta isoform X1 n=2 Tax=Patella vulgata TaxID=6465 RepID=UPI00217F2A5B|nr:beta-hexosaminidase subunit beta isoform X1 [Patella vulgata]